MSKRGIIWDKTADQHVKQIRSALGARMTIRQAAKEMKISRSAAYYIEVSALMKIYAAFAAWRKEMEAQ